MTEDRLTSGTGMELGVVKGLFADTGVEVNRTSELGINVVLTPPDVLPKLAEKLPERLEKTSKLRDRISEPLCKIPEAVGEASKLLGGMAELGRL